MDPELEVLDPVPGHSTNMQFHTFLDLKVGMHRISGRPDNPAFFYIRYPAGYQITLPDIRPNIR
jgi:hypothetical protein